MPHPKGGYKNKDKKRVPGVTTIGGRFKDAGGLLYWACDQGKAIERGEISNLYDKRDEAGEAGTFAHDLVFKDIRKDPDDPLPQYKGETEIEKWAWQGFRNYSNWAEDSKIKIIDQEMELVSEEYQYGGCPDAIGMDSRGQLCLLDWKTSKGIYVDYLVQLAAYKHLWEENHPEQPLVGGLHLLHFSKEYADFHHHYWSELDDAWEQFKLFRKAYDLDKKLKRRI